MAAYAGYASSVITRRQLREQLAQEDQDLKVERDDEARGNVAVMEEEVDEEDHSFVMIKDEEEHCNFVKDEYDECKFVKDEEDDCKFVKDEEEEEEEEEKDDEMGSDNDTSSEDVEDDKTELEDETSSYEEEDDTESQDETSSEEEDDAPPIPKRTLEIIITSGHFSPFNRSLAREIISAHRYRTMTRMNYGGVYKRYVCDGRADGVVYDRRTGKVVKRIVPSPIGTFRVYDRLHGIIRPIRMMDGEIRKNEGIRLQVAEREIEAGHLYLPLDMAGEMVPRPIRWNDMTDDLSLDETDIEMTLEDMEDDTDFEDDQEKTCSGCMEEESIWNGMKE